VLQSIPPAQVASVRLLKPLDAMTTLGQGHGGGAILVELRR
jgi:hypothetical protein